jgi:hypothetical protein
MASRVIIITNLDTENERTWGGKIYQPSEVYTVLENDYPTLATDDILYEDIVTIAQVSDGTALFESKINAWNYIIGNYPQEVIPKTIKNEHAMQPCGCVKSYFYSHNVSGVEDYVTAITLLDQSVDGKTFSYVSDIIPTIGSYVFQDEATRRSWIVGVDSVSGLVTFYHDLLTEGEGLYSRGHYIDCFIPDWFPTMHIWGVTITIKQYDENNQLINEPCESFIEFSIVDEYDLLKMDAYTQALFGVDAVSATPYIEAIGFEAFGEFDNHWVRYYDESWVLNVENKYTHTPDGAPGELLANFDAKLAFFATENIPKKYKVFLDYYFTVKD